MRVNLADRRLVIVLGKGGVGKTTVASSIALAASRQGRRVLLISMGATEKISSVFGTPPVRYDPSWLGDNLYAIHITPTEALKEYGLMKLKLKTFYKMVFDTELVQRILKVIPGMNELLLLGKATYMEQLIDRRAGRPVWDMIVLDGPATGHGVGLLSLPHVILEAVQVGPMADEARKIRDLLTDPAKTVLNIITLPEEMPFQETLQLRHQQEQVLRIPDGYLFVNCVYPTQFTPKERRIIRECLHDGAQLPATIREVASVTQHFVKRRRMQERYIEKYKSNITMPLVQLPFVSFTKLREKAVVELSRLIEEETMSAALFGAGLPTKPTPGPVS